MKTITRSKITSSLLISLFLLFGGIQQQIKGMENGDATSSLSPDGLRKAVITKDGLTIKIISTASNKILRTFRAPYFDVMNPEIKSISWVKNDLIYAISYLHDVFKINPNTGKSTYSAGQYGEYFDAIKEMKKK